MTQQRLARSGGSPKIVGVRKFYLRKVKTPEIELLDSSYTALTSHPAELFFGAFFPALTLINSPTMLTASSSGVSAPIAVPMGQ